MTEWARGFLLADFQLHMLWFPTSNNRAHFSCSIVQVNTGGRLELHAICYRLPTMRPSQGHRSHTLASDIVPTGGLSRSGASLVQAREQVVHLPTLFVSCSFLLRGALHYLPGPDRESISQGVIQCQWRLDPAGDTPRITSSPSGLSSLYS